MAGGYAEALSGLEEDMAPPPAPNPEGEPKESAESLLSGIETRLARLRSMLPVDTDADTEMPA